MPDWVPNTISVASILLTLGSVGLPLLALANRLKTGKGIGWQFIRYSVIVASIPLVGMLALQKSLTPEVATIIATALGYAFGQSGSSGGTDA
jgi:hypothetical protein